MTKKNSYWAAPALVAATLLSVYAAYGLFPFGTGTISWCDMNQQVIPFLMDLRNVLTGQANLFLNLQNAGGMNFWGVFLFFVSSPFSFLVLLVDKAQIYYFVNILLLLKMMTCSLTACGYLIRRFPNLGALQVTAISVMYAFCGYTMFYYQNIVWLDVMYLFPLLLIGLEKLAEEGKPLFYTLIFAAILTVNFYLSYMVVVFLILAAGAWLLFSTEKQRKKEKILLFGLSTVVSGLLTGVVWLPSLLQYLTSARTGDLISSLRTGTLVARLDTTLAVILCTAAIGAAVIMALVTRKYREPHVRMVLCLLVATMIPVFVEPINKMWQTGSYQSFPVRYGYMPVFLGLILLASCISGINRETELSKQDFFSPVSVVTAAAAVVAVIFCANVILKYNFHEVTAYTQTLWGSPASLQRLSLFTLAACLVYLILLLQFHYKRLSRTAFSVFLCAIAVVEAAFYSNIYIASTRNNAQYYTPIMDLGNQIHDTSLYRVKMDDKYFDVNLMGGMGYNSLSHYTSLTSKNYMFAMKKIGYSSYWMEVNSNGGTELTDAVLGNKYSVVRTEGQYGGKAEDTSHDNEGDPVYSNGLYSIVKNKNILPMGIVMKSSNIGNLKYLPDTTRLLTQQYLFQSIFSSNQELFEQYEPTSLDNVDLKKTDQYEVNVPDRNFEGTITYRIPVKGTQTLYFDCFDQLTNKLYEHINSSFSITVNGKILDIEYPTQSVNGLYRLGTFHNETAVVEIGILRNVYAKSFGIAGLKENVLSSAVSSVQKASLRQSGNSIVGTVSADGSDDYLFLPVTYAGGYSALVNGKPAAVSRVFDTFMAVKLEKGANKVSVTYIPEGFLPGLALTLCGVFCTFLLVSAQRKGRLKRMKKVQNVFEVLFKAVLVCTVAAIYILPIVIYFI